MLAMLLMQSVPPNVFLIGGGILVFIFFILIIWASRYTKVPPNAVMVVSGGMGQRLRGADGKSDRIGFRIIKGGGTFVVPVLERVDILSLELMTIDVRTPEVYTQQGVPIIVDGVAQIKIRSDNVSIATAVEQFLSKPSEEIARIAQQTLEGHLRAIMGTMTVEEIYRNRDSFAQKVQEFAAADLANMGLQIVSFTIRDVKDNEGYLDALGKTRTAEVKRDAAIGESQANRDATIKAAEFRQQGETAKFGAETKIASSNRDYEIEVANYAKDVNREKAEADLAYELQKNKSMNAVREEQVNVEITEKTRRIELENLEIERKQKELEATVQRPADAKKYEIERVAEAERFRLENVAEGEARSKRLTGLAEADVVKAQGEADGAATRNRGLAEAEVKRQKGLAEAEIVLQTQLAEAEGLKQKGLAEALAAQEKAKAWQEYNEAAIAQLLIERLPEIAAAISAPMSQIERIVVVGGGDGSRGTGASKITQDIGMVLAELPPVVKALSGVDLAALIERLPDIASGKYGGNGGTKSPAAVDSKSNGDNDGGPVIS